MNKVLIQPNPDIQGQPMKNQVSIGDNPDE
jgi:hypothetical protein